MPNRNNDQKDKILFIIFFFESFEMPITGKRLKHGFKNRIGQIIEKESGS